MPIPPVLRREARVALSRRAQPLWFRVGKWVVVLALVARYWDSPTFWTWMGIALAASLALHLLWRKKTKGWTQPWGGWKDLDAGR
jgi:hypothetical protein